MERRAAKSLESTAKHPNAKETGLEAASLGHACVESDRRTKRRKISDDLSIADELISVCHATPQATHISSEQAHELTNRAQGFLTTEEQAAAVETKRVTAITKFCEVLDGAGKYEYRYVEQLDAQFKIIAAISLGKHKAKKAITGWGLFKNRFSEEDFTVWLRSWLLPLNKLKKA